MISILKKSKQSIITLLLLLFIMQAFAQTAEFNHKKYWYLRWRLKNYFMVEGEGPGKSIPAGIREKYYDETNIGGPNYYSTALDFGDSPNYLAHYIGVLATEYHLLSFNNQNTAKTVEELYYALKAIIRMDNCEAQYPWNKPSNKLDGLCSRNSTPPTFVQDNYNSLNKNLDWFAPVVSNYGDPDSTFKVQIATSIGMNGFPDKPNVDKEGGMMSQDHISSMLVAMALIKKFVPNWITYNGLNLHQEAKNIANRFIDYMKGGGWFLRYPDGEQIPTKWGGNAVTYAYGFAKAAHFIDSSNETYIYNVIAQTSKVTFWSQIGSSDFPLNSGSTWIYLNLAAVGDSWNYLPGVACLGIPAGMNCTQVRIWKHSLYYDWQAYYPLLHAVLHNKKCKTTNDKILNDLNTTPCSGHWNLGGNKSPYWATSHKYHSTKHDNKHGDVGFEGKYNGLEYMLLFNLYCIYNPSYISNYYAIIDDEISHIGFYPKMEPYSSPPSYLAAMGAEDNYWPAFKGVPLTVHAFRNVQSTAVIENKNMSGTYPTVTNKGNPVTVTITMQGNVQASVTYKAGEGITLKPGFHAKTGVTFHAYIDPLTCNSNGSNYERIAGTWEEDEDEEEENTKVEEKEEQVFTIAPNPGNGMFHISYAPAQSNTLQVEIINITGTLVYSNNIITTENKYMQTDIDISNFAQGVYLLRLQDGDKIKTAKIIVQ